MTRAVSEGATAAASGSAVPPLALEKIGSAKLPTTHATFAMTVYRDGEGKEHLVLSLGELAPPAGSDLVPPLVRLHSECLTGDALGSLRCDCGPQLQEALRRIAAEGRGAVFYLRQEGRGIGLGNKVRAYALQDEGADTVDANQRLGFADDARDYGLAAGLVRQLGLSAVRLLTNNPRKVAALERAGIRVVERIPLLVGENPHNAGYLATKRARLGHLAAE